MAGRVMAAKVVAEKGNGVVVGAEVMEVGKEAAETAAATAAEATVAVATAAAATAREAAAREAAAMAASKTAARNRRSPCHACTCRPRHRHTRPGSGRC